LTLKQKIDFDQIKQVYLPNEQLFNGNHNTLVEAKSSQNILGLKLLDGNVIELKVAPDGFVSVYKSLIDLAVFLISHDSGGSVSD
jgi:hypothetical protein